MTTVEFPCERRDGGRKMLPRPLAVPLLPGAPWVRRPELLLLLFSLSFITGGAQTDLVAIVEPADYFASRRVEANARTMLELASGSPTEVGTGSGSSWQSAGWATTRAGWVNIRRLSAGRWSDWPTGRRVYPGPRRLAWPGSTASRRPDPAPHQRTVCARAGVVSGGCQPGRGHRTRGAAGRATGCRCRHHPPGGASARPSC